MSRIDHEIRVTPSVLDRLIDLEPRHSEEAPKSRSTSLHELKQSVRRDLEWLLNTRCHIDAIDDKLEETPNSVAFYGLPDFTGVSVKSHIEQKRMTRAIEDAIRRFEPRFINLKVFMDPLENVDRQLRFRIEATLDTEPAPEPIVFDSVLNSGGGGFEVVEL
ncbi:MAG TPA: type VI secretion system baseplate subunit TssE [Pyrinomonadaceae bacterium]|nr:type VI secretion system baseplate subunit TssE [Pyrinomonadaceae bacterium]HMP64356.1 type VI secretion system baseplate subunit TssE [Pyrinomonadaceae bacterium]